MASVDMCEHEWPGSGCRQCFPSSTALVARLRDLAAEVGPLAASHIEQLEADKRALVEALTRLRPYLPKVAEILDVVKLEWGDSWTEWAQGIRAETTALMLLTETDPAIRATFDQARGKQ